MVKKLKVLFVWHGAVEKSYRQLFYEMTKLGVEVIVITAKRWYEAAKWQDFEPVEIDKYYKVYPLRTIFTNHIRAFFYFNLAKMKWIVFKEKPDVIYIKEEPYSTACFFITTITKFLSPKTKIIIESDENIYKTHPFPFNFFEKVSLKLTDALSLVATDAFEIYKNKNFNRPMYKTIYFIPYFPVSTDKKLKMGGSFKLKVGFVGRVVEEKGIDNIILALYELKNRGLEDTCLYIVGGIGDKQYYDYIVKLSSKKGVNVEFLGTFTVNEIGEFYSFIDVLVLPSRTKSWWKEQFGRVLVEAMACGTPCVGSSSGEIPRVINNPDLIFEEDNYVQLADILEKFYKREYSKEKMSKDLIEYSKNFTIEAVAKNKVKIIENLISYGER